MPTLKTPPTRRPAAFSGIAPNVRLVRERPVHAADLVEVRTACDAASFLAPRLNAEEVEVFLVLCLNAQHRIVGQSEVTRGIVNASLVAPREAFRIAIAMNAVSVIFAHNHPSGNATPSADDRAITQKLVDAGRILDIPVHDHVIVAGVRSDGSPNFISFSESGLL